MTISQTYQSWGDSHWPEPIVSLTRSVMTSKPVIGPTIDTPINWLFNNSAVGVDLNHKGLTVKVQGLSNFAVAVVTDGAKPLSAARTKLNDTGSRQAGYSKS